jgi:hypothetical protein
VARELGVALRELSIAARRGAGAHRDEVTFSHGSYVSDAERDQSVSAARSSDEFDFEEVTRVNVDDGAEVASSEGMLWHIPRQDDGIEFPVGHQRALG